MHIDMRNDATACPFYRGRNYFAGECVPSTKIARDPIDDTATSTNARDRLPVDSFSDLSDRPIANIALARVNARYVKRCIAREILGSEARAQSQVNLVHDARVCDISVIAVRLKLSRSLLTFEILIRGLCVHR